MLRYAFGSFAVLGALILAGCAGTDFVRPTPDTLKLGETTFSDVVQRFGEPRTTGTTLVNGKTLKTIAYSYATQFDEPNEPRVIPVRSMAYYFLGDTLVGYGFMSSFKSDNSDFRNENIGKIEKGKSSRADVIRVLGEPTGFYIAPMVKSTSGMAFGYRYATVKHRPAPFSAMPVARKSLTVSFDEGGLVSEIDFSSSESN